MDQVSGDTGYRQSVLASASYPRTYRYSIAVRWFVYVIAAAIMAGGVWLMFMQIRQASAPAVFLWLGLGALGLGLFMAASCRVSCLTLRADAIEARRLFSTRRLRRDDIKGRRLVPTRGKPISVLVARSGPPLRLDSGYQGDGVLDAWIATLPDLDQQERDASRAKLAADRPGDAAVENALRRAKKMREDQLAIEKAVSGQLEVADQALARKDFDSALIGYTAAKQLDPKSQRASTGVEAVAKVKAEVTVIRDRFEKALKARDLTSAQHELDALRTLVPGSPALVLAENDFSNSKLIEEVQAKANAEKALQLTGQAKELSVRMDDPSQSIPDLEQGLKDFLAKAGVDHPQRGFLERKLEDRRLRLQVVAVLGTLDAAVVQKNIGGIKAVVADAVFASALADLTAYPGLVFSSHLDDFIRTGDRVTVKVSVRHALSVFPERTLSYLYDLHHSEQGWTISGAHLQQR